MPEVKTGAAKSHRVITAPLSGIVAARLAKRVEQLTGADHVQPRLAIWDDVGDRRTPRSSNDCLIAQIVMEGDLILLHDDRNFDAIAAVSGELRLYPVRWKSREKTLIRPRLI